MRGSTFSDSAISTFCFAIVVFLLGCESDKKPEAASVDIWKAVEREDLEAIQRYARKGGDLEAGQTLYGKTPLIHAFNLKKKESYRKLLAVGANPNAICRGGAVVIHFAAAEKDSFWLREALKSKGDPNLLNDVAKGLQRTTPIFFAISAGVIDNVKLLVEHGAEIDQVDRWQETPLTYACSHAQFEIVHYLLEQGADYNKPLLKELTFIWNFQHKSPENYPNPEKKKWFLRVQEWLADRGVTPERTKWDGEKWIFE